MAIITLTTDFGIRDPFSGVMKGVIYSICPKAEIVDLTHEVPPQDIYYANFIIRTCYRYFPKGTIHVCVVDPGVGSTRRPILIQTSNYIFIGPDNGVFTTIIQTENIICAIELTNNKFFLPEVSQTFHGRDIFAPVAAHLAKGTTPKAFGNKLKKEELNTLLIKQLVKKEGSFIGYIQFIDHFGNLITNVPNNVVPSKIIGKIGKHSFEGLVSSFSEAKSNQLTAIKGSSGYIELFIYKGSAAKFASANIGEELEVIKT